MLHLRCGTDILWKLDEAGVPGRKVSWADPLCQGPVPVADRAALRPVRAAFLAGHFGPQNDLHILDLQDADAAVDGAAAEDEVVLWFEADLFDQAILVHLLPRLGHLLLSSTRLSIVTLHAYPGVSRFIGLGQLNAAQLGKLFQERRPVSPDMVATATTAWAAWCSPTPEALEGLAREEARAMPYLQAAVARLLEELPEVTSGLGRTERTGLTTISQGSTTLFDSFREVQEQEERPWLGDAMYFTMMRELTTGPAPLIAFEGNWPSAQGGNSNPAVVPTAEGQAVLAGELDWWPVSGRRAWLGGTELGPGMADWRWDARDRKVRRVQ